MKHEHANKDTNHVHIYNILLYIFLMIYLDILNKTGVYPYFFVCQCEICRYVFFLIFLFGFKQLQHIFYLNMISVCKYSVSFDI